MNRLIIALGPKSAEQEDHIAPILLVPKKEIIVSGILGRTAAILSPFLIFIFLK